MNDGFETNEGLRKFLHIVFGLGALALKFLPWRVAALIAAAAVIVNWLILHRLVGRRVARHERGWDPGIVLYPAAVAAAVERREKRRRFDRLSSLRWRRRVRRGADVRRTTAERSRRRYSNR